MKKNAIKIFIILLFLLCLFIFILKFYPFGNKVYIVDSIEINIPILSKVVENEDNYIVLKTFRSKYSIQKELEKILEDYERYNCDSSNTFYYNKKNNYTILYL